MEHLYQKTLFGKRELKIYDSKFSYTFFNFGSVNEFNIPFEKLTNDKLSQKKVEIAFLFVALCSYAFAVFVTFNIEATTRYEDLIMIFILFAGATVSLIVFFLQKQDLWKIHITDGTILTIYKKVPDSASVDDFYNALITARNKYVKQEYYTNMNPDLSLSDKLQNLKWLKSLKAITEEEFEAKTNELNSVKKQAKIGF